MKVAIVEDHHTFRQCLEFLLKNTDGFRSAGSFRTMEEALEGFGPTLPDVVLLDIGLPGMSGIEGVKVSERAVPRGAGADEHRLRRRRAHFRCPVRRSVRVPLKKMPPSQILDSVTQAVAGGAPMSPEVARRVIELFRQLRPSENADYGLTPHEVRLLQLARRGPQLRIGGRAAQGDRQDHLLPPAKDSTGKLHVHSKSEAVSKGLRKRLIK